MPTTTTDTTYIPALRFRWLTRFFDRVLAATLPEVAFKGELVKEAALGPGETVLDLGSGTGTLAIMLKEAQPNARVIGVDADPEILEIGRAKANELGASIDFHRGFADAVPVSTGSVDAVVSSLVFHHLSPKGKRNALDEVRRVLKPGGELLILDWGKAHGPLMRFLFLAVQALDGFESTSENVRGELPRLMEQAGFTNVREVRRGRTIFGTLSIYRAEAPTS